MVTIKINEDGDVLSINRYVDGYITVCLTTDPEQEGEYLQDAMIGLEALPKVIEALQAELAEGPREVVG